MTGPLAQWMYAWFLVRGGVPNVYVFVYPRLSDGLAALALGGVPLLGVHRTSGKAPSEGCQTQQTTQKLATGPCLPVTISLKLMDGIAAQGQSSGGSVNTVCLPARHVPLAYETP